MSKTVCFLNLIVETQKTMLTTGSLLYIFLLSLGVITPPHRLSTSCMSCWHIILYFLTLMFFVWSVKKCFSHFLCWKHLESFRLRVLGCVLTSILVYLLESTPPILCFILRTMLLWILEQSLCVPSKWNPIPFIVHYRWSGPIGFQNRVPLGT